MPHADLPRAKTTPVKKTKTTTVSPTQKTTTTTIKKIRKRKKDPGPSSPSAKLNAGSGVRGQKNRVGSRNKGGFA